MQYYVKFNGEAIDILKIKDISEVMNLELDDALNAMVRFNGCIRRQRVLKGKDIINVLKSRI